MRRCADHVLRNRMSIGWIEDVVKDGKKVVQGSRGAMAKGSTSSDWKRLPGARTLYMMCLFLVLWMVTLLSRRL